MEQYQTVLEQKVTKFLKTKFLNSSSPFYCHVTSYLMKSMFGWFKPDCVLSQSLRHALVCSLWEESVKQTLLALCRDCSARDTTSVFYQHCLVTALCELLWRKFPPLQPDPVQSFSYNMGSHTARDLCLCSSTCRNMPAVQQEDCSWFAFWLVLVWVILWCPVFTTPERNTRLLRYSQWRQACSGHRAGLYASHSCNGTWSFFVNYWECCQSRPGSM